MPPQVYSILMCLNSTLLLPFTLDAFFAMLPFGLRESSSQLLQKTLGLPGDLVFCIGPNGVCAGLEKQQAYTAFWRKVHP
mmetsp:Transcript_11700/g.18752  ORF Transcript_11700/g.18752 Transcript_11700/m.18752 type:complete len:80 (-) Transcript_11700:480-719(-)